MYETVHNNNLLVKLINTVLASHYCAVCYYYYVHDIPFFSVILSAMIHAAIFSLTRGFIFVGKSSGKYNNNDESFLTSSSFRKGGLVMWIEYLKF